MIRSMTGYGQAVRECGDSVVRVEVRSVNNRYADIRLRLPQDFQASEMMLRKRVLSVVQRGRIDVTVKLEAAPGKTTALQVNRARAEAWLRAAKDLSEIQGVEGSIDLVRLLRMPGVVEEHTDTCHPEGLIEVVGEVLTEALSRFDEARLLEGKALTDDLAARLRAMEERVGAMNVAAAGVSAEVRTRLEERLAKLTGDLTLDPTRVAQEALLLADRADVTEELVRLGSHLSRDRKLIEQPDGKPVGKRLDFLLQEIHRETNTVGSKSTRSSLGDLVLEMKSENEKVREQVQNLE